MNSYSFIFISLFAGVLAGLVLASINYFVAEPFMDQAIEIEVENSITEGEVIDSDELSVYRIWQKEGTFVAGALFGLTYGAILGIVFVFARRYLPSSDDRKKALILAGLMCLTLYVIPFLKYPANPPAVGDPETIAIRDSLYTGFQLASGLIILGLSVFWFKFKTISLFKYLIPAFYVGLIGLVFYIFPANPDPMTLPIDLVNSFRMVTFTTMIMFYLVLGIVFGVIWYRYKPHEATRLTTS
ncbi:CbtA family protein [Candidatus Nitrosocosmicus franklandus]|uniref:Putative cobalt transporter subunit (CbtA) n=1 Tax=Candidatus Nitrosocosmicus franklandianus TaxID=1798806 RepID=A0A484I6Q0_9ARCH|nr:CbtA family protein [Candidatus Nitrosocosmicus franklandus]VFJ13398.1 putative cobalt transporter subunit (CbtA) [Candidatus Nitrosocosmicus franklandus]